VHCPASDPRIHYARGIHLYEGGHRGLFTDRIGIPYSAEPEVMTAAARETLAIYFLEARPRSHRVISLSGGAEIGSWC